MFYNALYWAWASLESSYRRQGNEACAFECGTMADYYYNFYWHLPG